jgi:ribosomal protein L39E
MLAKHKTLQFKVMLHAERKRRSRGPVWAFAKAKKRLFPRVGKIHWRRTELGHIVRRKLGITQK